MIEQAREAVAAFVGARPSEVIFTSSGTEAVNLASRIAITDTPSISVLARVEHSAVRSSALRAGRVVELGVDATGRIDLDQLESLIKDAGDGHPPRLVHCQMANHEVGTIQPVLEVTKLCREAGVMTHVDACTGAGMIPFSFASLGADMVSISSHKIGGPPGVGALVVRRALRIPPLILGGDQERARRAGMENALGIIGFAGAARELCTPGRIETESTAARRYSDQLRSSALQVDGVTLYGNPVERAPHIVCIGVSGIEAEGILFGLDRAGIAVHTGSACSSESFEPSPVLQAMGVDASHSLRLSVGWSTTDEDVEAFEATFPQVVASLRALRH